MTFTKKPNQLQQSLVVQKSLLHRMIKQIRRSLDLPEILATTVSQVRSFLDVDRVKVYRFNAGGNGEVIAESIHEQRLPSLLGLNFPVDDIPEAAREMFLLLGQRSIVDVPNGKIGLSPLQSEETGKHLESNIYYRQVDSCHIQYLKAMGVQSSLVMPILNSDLQEQSAKPKLWGLLVAHHSEPREILKRELKVLQEVTDELGIAIAQSNLLTQSLAKQEREATINRVTTLLHKLPTIQLQKALEQVINGFGGVGGRLHIEQNQELYTWGDQPKLPYESDDSIIEEHLVWQDWMAEFQQGDVWTSANLYEEPRLRVLALGFRSTKIRGLMVIPLHYREKFIGVLSIFRSEFETEVLWAGRCEDNRRQILPQLSFELWREQKKGQSSEWKPEEILLAQALAEHFSMAIEQHQMYKEVQMLNANLELKVQEQTAELEKSLLLAKVLKQVTEHIRRTLDLQTTLQSIVREVRPLLNSDRVLIFQMKTKSVIVEEINGNWQSVLGLNAPAECFSAEYSSLAFHGRIRAVNNVSTADLSECHREFLQSMQVQANLIVPIRFGVELWGLIIAHECEAPRDWQDAEIDLLQQLADQAAIAIQQAQLYEQICNAETESINQAVQLAHSLHELKETQTKLIKIEKMSGLGQLVAGVAHEINKRVDLHEGIDSTLLILQHRLKGNAEFLRIEVIKDYGNIPLVECYASQMNQVFMNIISNAIDALEMANGEWGMGNEEMITENNGNNQYNLSLVLRERSVELPTIRISTKLSVDNSRLLIRIIDNGSGMTEEVKKRIFDPFYTTKPVGKGTGLGLSISYQIIVEKHGGIMECISEPGKGTEFWIQIPVKPPATSTKILAISP